MKQPYLIKVEVYITTLRHAKHQGRLIAGFRDDAASAAFLDEGARLKGDDSTLLVEWLRYAGGAEDDAVKSAAAAMEAAAMAVAMAAVMAYTWA